VEKVCLIADCKNPIKARGYCARHHHRLLRHGDPLGGDMDRGTAMKTLDGILSSDTGECIDWPHARHKAGYGAIRIDGKTRTVHRLVCLKIHGDPPSKSKRYAAHSCGRHSCCNPRHLRWATHSENMMDRHFHGTDTSGEQHWNSKLTESDVSKIKQLLKGNMTTTGIGRQFGVTGSAIDQIKRGVTWRWVK
jgi:hypothetical protein